MENENYDQNKVNSTISKAEARRRKILENGNNRLGKITGRVHNEGMNYLKNCEMSRKKHDI